MKCSSQAEKQVRLLTGEYQRTVDSEGRILVPNKIRKLIDEDLYIVLGANGILSLYLERDFKDMINAIVRLNLAPDEAVSFERMYYGLADKIELDGHGGLLLEKRVRERARLGDQITLLGLMDHMELWNTEHWEQYISDHMAQYQEQVRRARQVSLDDQAKR